MRRHGDEVGEAVRVDDGEAGLVVVSVFIGAVGRALLPVVILKRFCLVSKESSSKSKIKNQAHTN